MEKRFAYGIGRQRSLQFRLAEERVEMSRRSVVQFLAGAFALLPASVLAQEQLSADTPRPQGSVAAAQDNELRQSEIEVSRRRQGGGFRAIDGSASVTEGVRREGDILFSVGIRHRATGRLAKPARTYGVIPGKFLEAGTPVYLTQYRLNGGGTSDEPEDFWCAPRPSEGKGELGPFDAAFCVPVSPNRNIGRVFNLYVSDEPPFLLSPQLKTPFNEARFLSQDIAGEVAVFESSGTVLSRYKPRLRTWSVDEEPVDFMTLLFAEGVLRKISKTEIEIEIRYREGDVSRIANVLRAPMSINTDGKPGALLEIFNGIALLEPIGSEPGLNVTMLRPIEAKISDDAIAPPPEL